MKQSLRAKRMQRNHKRHGQQAKLSLVSLMDIFTILVFFLMLNASDVQVLDNHKSIKLPQADTETPARETLLLLVNAKQILLQGVVIASVDSVMQENSDIIETLKTELEYRKARRGNEPGATEQVHAITIMGDQFVPYALLKKVLATCAQTGFSDVSLAVEQVSSDKAGDAYDSSNL